MKKQLLLLSLIGCLYFINAAGQNIRIPNSSFEIWDTLTTLTVPDSWPSSDLLWYYDGYNTRNVYPDRHSHSGKYSARIGPDTAAKKIWPGFIAAKFAINKIPEYFDFYYIDSINKAESGAVKITLSKWNKIKKTEDSISGTTWNFPDSIIKNFVFQRIPIGYVDTTVIPDSISITIEVVSSSTSLPAGHIAVDDVSLVPHSSWIEPLHHSISFHIFPNPSKGVFYIGSPNLFNYSAKIEIFSRFGQTIYSNYHNFIIPERIDLSNEPSNMYFIKITSGNQVSVDKIIISH